MELKHPGQHETFLTRSNSCHMKETRTTKYPFGIPEQPQRIFNKLILISFRANKAYQWNQTQQCQLGEM